MAEITHRTVQTNGINMHIAEAGEGPLVLLRPRLPGALVLVAAPASGARRRRLSRRRARRARLRRERQRRTRSRRTRMKNHVADALGILDALGEETAVIVGHDWGAPMAWNSAALHPDRYPRGGVAQRAVPAARRRCRRRRCSRRSSRTTSSTSSTSRSRASRKRSSSRTSGGRCGCSCTARRRGPRRSERRRRVHEQAGRLRSCSTAVRAREAAGLADGRGPRLLHRALQARPASAARSTAIATWTATGRSSRSSAGRRVQQPALFITGDKDPVGTFAPMDPMKASVPNLKIVTCLIVATGRSKSRRST